MAINVSHLHLLILAFDFQSEPPTSTSSWKQQDPATVGDSADDELGRSVALSANARTLVVGAPGDDFGNTNRKGYDEVFRTDKDGWKRTQLGQTIYRNAGDRFGRSIDITAEGNNIVLDLPGYYNNTDRPVTPWITMMTLAMTLGIRSAKTSSGKRTAFSFDILFLSLRIARELQSAPSTAPITIRVTS